MTIEQQKKPEPAAGASAEELRKQGFTIDDQGDVFREDDAELELDAPTLEGSF